MTVSEDFEAAVAELEAEDAIADSWSPLDLDDLVDGILDGTHEAPRPTVGALGDDEAWLYAGRTNGLAGESGSGKTWTALSAVVAEMIAGHHAVFVDLEDSPLGAVSRLVSMGVDPATVKTHFHYVRPEGRFAKEAFASVLDLYEPTLVVIDSTGEAMGLDSLDQNADSDVTTWFRTMPTWIASRGPAVLLLDHVAKAATGSTATPIGSQRKRAALSGVQFVQSIKKGSAFARGHAGEAVLTCTKDRGGFFVSGSPVAKLVVNPTDTMPDDSGCSVQLVRFDSKEWAPTVLMAEISEYLEAEGSAVSTGTISRNVTGKKSSIISALEVLVASDYVEMTYGPRNAKMYSHIASYQNGDAITIPDPVDDEGDGSQRTHDSQGRPLCTDPAHDEWHCGKWCDPEWCHPGHFGSCNRI